MPHRLYGSQFGTELEIRGMLCAILGQITPPMIQRAAMSAEYPAWIHRAATSMGWSRLASTTSWSITASRNTSGLRVT
jgi:hypothetical protein